MVAMTGTAFAFDDRQAQARADAIPPEAALVMTALEAGRRGRIDRRERARRPYRVTAQLHLFSDTEQTQPWTLYVRDASRRALGFITAHRLPLGYGGVLELLGPDGQPLSLHCTLLRCRQAAPAWYEGRVYFNREQPIFENQ